ncbi:MAG: FtsX-like permease family protein, partial [Lawsonibacter sp.]|nr:FtsX-like permease family protein [Lawsonibacter sp.]
YLNKFYRTDDGMYNYFYIMTMAEQANQINAMMGVAMGVLVAIAAISLLVGGIGIMNIMLVSVTERTREIGVRKSLGAKRRDIRSQFVIEAGTTSAIGGLLGIAFGWLLAKGLGMLLGGMLVESMGTSGITFDATPTMGAILLSFGVSVGIGVLFGYLPANKAAKLNPIDALRYD